MKTKAEIEGAVAGNYQRWTKERKKRQPDTRFIILLEAYLWTLGVFPPGTLVNKLAQKSKYKFFGFTFNYTETYSDVIGRIALEYLTEHDIIWEEQLG